MRVTTGADLKRLLSDRAYKEQHRPALTTFFQDEVRQRPRLLEEHFLKVVKDAVDVDVLFITGMREEAPVATLSHLVPDSKLLEVSVKASKKVRQVRLGCQGGDGDSSGDDSKDANGGSNLTTMNYRPSLIFNNDTPGMQAAQKFAERNLLLFFHKDMQQLADMMPPVPDFPSPGIDFRHVLDISQKPGGLSMCTTLLLTHFTGDWAKIDAVVCCEAGGFIYASALASRVEIPLALIREAGKLPPPTISTAKTPSHISSATSNGSGEKRVEVGRHVVSKGASVVVIDDVLATGMTICAVLQLLEEAGVAAEDVSIMAVAEFPVHGGRQLLR